MFRRLLQAANAVVVSGVCGIAAAHADRAPTPHIAVEGGAACSRNKSFVDINGIEVGDNGCAGTGAIEVGRTGSQVTGIFDHWAVRGRFTALLDKERPSSLAVYGGFLDRRYVADAELGTPVNLLNFFGGTQRITVGVRFAHWRGNFLLDDNTGTPREALRGEMLTYGAGPRVGLRTSVPLGPNFMYESQLGAAALYSHHGGRAFASQNGALAGTAGFSNSDFVFNIDSSSALSYKLDGSETGRVLSVGLFSEFWFQQAKSDANSTNRHSWGPFVRFRMQTP
jgi:hypothetical protein